MVADKRHVLGEQSCPDMGGTERLLQYDITGQRLCRRPQVHLCHLREGPERLFRDRLVHQDPPVWWSLRAHEDVGRAKSDMNYGAN